MADQNATNTPKSDQDKGSTLSNIPTPTDLTRYQHGPATVTALVQRATDCDQKFATLLTRLTSAQNAANEAKVRIANELEGLRGTLSENDIQRAKNKKTSTALRELREGTNKSRWAMLKELEAIDREITATAEMYQSPAHILARHGLGTEERSRYLEQIERSGPIELGNFARHAVATRDKTLAAALMSKLDRLDTRERELSGVNRTELAKALAGEEHQNAQAAIQRVRQRVREAFARNRAFEQGKPMSTLDQIGLALGRAAEPGTKGEGE